MKQSQLLKYIFNSFIYSTVITHITPNKLSVYKYTILKLK